MFTFIFGAILVAAILFLLFVAVGCVYLSIHMLRMKLPAEREIVSTGDCFEDAKRFGEYLAYRSEFYSLTDKDMKEKYQEAINEGRDADVVQLLRLAHLTGYKLKIKEIK